jgi:hypothetical protein
MMYQLDWIAGYLSILRRGAQMIGFTSLSLALATRPEDRAYRRFVKDAGITVP